MYGEYVSSILPAVSSPVLCVAFTHASTLPGYWSPNAYAPVHTQLVFFNHILNLTCLGNNCACFQVSKLLLPVCLFPGIAFVIFMKSLTGCFKYSKRTLWFPMRIAIAPALFVLLVTAFVSSLPIWTCIGS